MDATATAAPTVLPSAGREVAPARVLIASNYNRSRRASEAALFEFAEVVSQCDDALVSAPPSAATTGRGEWETLLRRGSHEVRRALSKVRQRAGLKGLAGIEPGPVTGNHELFVYLCSTPEDLVDLDRFQGWRERSGTAVAVILETWSDLMDRQRAHLRMLDPFDKVFLYQQASLPAVQRHTRAPCLPLRGGVDALLAAPDPGAPPRVVDVYSTGRRSSHMHEQLVDMAEKHEIFYVYEPTANGRVLNWHESRLLTLNLVKRARFFPALEHVSRSGDVGEPALPIRYYEATAGGAVIIGPRPRAAEFAPQFDWDDALVELDPDGVDMRALLAEMGSDPARTKRISLTNSIEALRRFDWSYRWAEILESVGLEPTPAMACRHRTLENLASILEGERQRL